MQAQLTIKVTTHGEGESQLDLREFIEEVDSCGQRDRISFATNLNAEAKEKLKTISHKEDVSMADLVNYAVKATIRELERRRGEEYTVPDIFRVEDA